MKRVEANDPVAMCLEGTEQRNKGDYTRAFGYYAKASKLGDAEAHVRLASLYHFGQGVEKDVGKEIHHMEEAAIGGHPGARYDLGCYQDKNGNIERAVKHYFIAAIQGHDDSIKCLMVSFKGGFISRDLLAATVRAHQAALAATKCPQREVGDEYCRIMNS